MTKANVLGVVTAALLLLSLVTPRASAQAGGGIISWSPGWPASGQNQRDGVWVGAKGTYSVPDGATNVSVKVHIYDSLCDEVYSGDGAPFNGGWAAADSMMAADYYSVYAELTYTLNGQQQSVDTLTEGLWAPPQQAAGLVRGLLGGPGLIRALRKARVLMTSGAA